MGVAQRYEAGSPLLDAAIAELATRQHRVIRVGQLEALGLSRGGIARRVARGQLHRVHRGVYAVGPLPLPDLGRLLAAVFACGENAVLSHRSAGALWRLRRWSGRIEVTVLTGRKGPSGVTVRRARSLHPDDITVFEGIPITTPARTLVDLTERLDDFGMDRAVHQSEFERLFDLPKVRAAMHRAHGRRHLAKLERAIAAFEPRSQPTRSGLEERFLRIVFDLGERLPLVNTHVDVGDELVEVDMLFAEERLAVEIDGGDAHGTRRARERDPYRDEKLLLAGFRPLRFTEQRIVSDRGGVGRSLLAALALGRG